jgi:hypothetical protein
MGASMKTIIFTAVIAIALTPLGAFAQERVGEAALGALSGAVVLGPVGAGRRRCGRVYSRTRYCQLMGAKAARPVLQAVRETLGIAALSPVEWPVEPRRRLRDAVDRFARDLPGCVHRKH